MNEELKVKQDGAVPVVKEVQSPIRKGLKTKDAIVANWLPRYTGRPLEAFGDYIILTNFSQYIPLFS